MCLALAWVGGDVLAADPPVAAATDDSGEPKTLSQTSIFASVKQSLTQNDNDVVRGHFDLGTPPHLHRYYCMVDSKTGRRQVNAVVGDPVPAADGMTTIKGSAVSLYRCAEAEREGMLVTAGYVLTGAAASSAASAKAAAATAASAAAAAPASVAPPVSTAATRSTVLPSAVPAAPTYSAAATPLAAATMTAPDQIDVAGIRLGMSPDEVRAALKSKKLIDYHEATETLSYLDSAKGAMQPVANGRFVNVITAWTPPASPGSDSLQVDGESFEVLFTPVPGRERVLGIVHSVGYSPANAPRETVLESGLVKKYGGDASNDLPQSPTWRFLSGGTVLLGDPCNRRGTLGGLGSLTVPSVARENLALKKPAADLQSQIEQCGAALVTEDHHTANGGALPEDRLVTRFTVTAYSPAIALDGARLASQLIQNAGGTASKADAGRSQPLNKL
jgi:hypothetical protein